jgi:hypothetical protein
MIKLQYELVIDLRKNKSKILSIFELIFLLTKDHKLE